MATRKRAAGARTLKLFIGSFTFDPSNEDPDRDGVFQLLVTATSARAATPTFRARLKELRAKYDVLDEVGAVYLDGVAELTLPVTVCVLVDYRETVRRKTGSYTVGNTAPEQGLEIETYGYGEEDPAEGECSDQKPFITFRSKRKAKRASSKRNSRP